MTSGVDIHQAGGILHLIMNRPERRNALTHAMYSALADGLREADENAEIRAIRITGAGGHFTSGNDLEDFRTSPPTTLEAPVFHFLEALRAARKPLVAEVSGVAVGIGTTLLMHCDLVYSDASARFQLPFTSLGLCPEGGSSLLLPLIAGPQRAAELLMFGDMFDAEAAQAAGIVTHVKAADALSTAVQTALERLAAQPPAAVRLAKSLLRSSYAQRLEIQMREESELFIQRLRSDEAREAITAFHERRRPDFSRCH